MDKSQNKLLNRLRDVIALDLRSLALLRMGLALVVMADLLSRFQGLTAHYSDQGVLPRSILTEKLLHPWYWSLHLLSGAVFWQFLLFLLTFIIALALLVGYRTRLASIAVWALMVSLQNRNPALIFAGDDVLRAILFWAMFLPLSGCYSIDSALNSSNKPIPKRISSGATFAFMVQLCFVYTWSAAYKTKSNIWFPDGDAVYYSLSFDQYVTGLGQWLLTFPESILKTITYSTLVFEWVGPFLIFIPFWIYGFRTIAIVSFVALHFGFGLSFKIGILSYLSIVNWLALIPSEIWDNLAKRISTEERRGLTIYYDADCGFCKKVVYLIRTFAILPKTPLLMAQDEAEIYEEMQQINSWVVVDYQGHHHHQFEAIAYVSSISPVFFPLAPLLRWQPIMSLGTKFYKTVANNRKTAGLFTRPFKFRPLDIHHSLLMTGIALILLFLTTLWNFKSFVDQTVYRRKTLQKDWINTAHHLFNRRTFQMINILGYVTRLDQSWSIFAPNPPRDDGWHVMIGTDKDGKKVNVLQNNQPINWDKLSPKQRQDIYRTIQWRVYYINLSRENGSVLYPYFADYICRVWNQKHQGNQQLDQLAIYYLDERTVPPDETQKVEKKEILTKKCVNDPQ